MGVVKLEGFDQLNWLVFHFKMDVEQALDTMVKNNQNMSFLIEYCERVNPTKSR
jgi:hypothetical protein